MVHVQEGHMWVFLLQHKEHGVDQVADFGEEVVVSDLGDSYGCRIVGVVNRLAENTVASRETEAIALDHDVCTESHLK